MLAHTYGSDPRRGATTTRAAVNYSTAGFSIGDTAVYDFNLDQLTVLNQETFLASQPDFQLVLVEQLPLERNPAVDSAGEINFLVGL